MNFELIQIQTTGTCNARCEVCPFRSSWFIDNHGIMKENLFNNILDQIDPNYEGKICPYLMNEPFTDPDIINRTQKIVDKLSNAEVEISTNTELLNTDKIKDIVNVLLKARKAKLVISHHGINKETFESIMHINYEKALRNAINLISEVDGRIPLAIQTMAYSKDNKYHYHSIRRVKRYWDRVFRDNNLRWNNVWLSTLQFHNRAGNVNIGGWDYEQKVRDIGPNNPFYCSKFDKSLNILWNGDLVLCCMDYMHETKFGNVNEQTIEQAFSSKEHKELIDMGTGKKESPENFICKRCQVPSG